jgi:hypothetical protein
VGRDPGDGKAGFLKSRLMSMPRCWSRRAEVRSSETARRVRAVKILRSGLPSAFLPTVRAR